MNINNFLTFGFIIILGIPLSMILLPSIEWYEAFCISFFIAIAHKFINDLGKNISIKNIIALIATLQWMVGSSIRILL